MSIFLIASLVLLALFLAWLVYAAFWGKPPFIHWAVERLSLRRVLKDPEALTVLGLADNTPLDFHSGDLTDASPHWMERLRALDRDGIALIQRFDPQKLKGQKLITYQLMSWYFKQNLRGHRFAYHWGAGPVFTGPYPVNHIYGPQVDLVQFLTTYHKIKGRRSVRRYLARLAKIRGKFSGLIESLAHCADAGAIPPRFVIEKCLDQVEGFLSQPLGENPLYTSFMEKASASSRLSGKAAARWGAKVQRVIENKVNSAYRSLQSVLEELLSEASDEDGVWKLPDGEAYYAFLLRGHTTTDRTPDEIHLLGLAEVKRLAAEIQGVLEMLGLPTDNPGAQLQALMAAPQHHFQGESPREEIINSYQAILEEVNARLPEIFTYGALEEITVKRLPEYKEADSPIAYAQPPALDGSRPGTMWLNLREPENIYSWGMRTLAYHEGIPGHVYQMAQAQKIKGLPTFRRAYFFNAYVEGWALYAERLGWDLGLEDALSNLGRLQALIWRAARLVVDTGIHVKQWTRQEAIDYMVSVTGLPERDVITEVERYIVMPGQACAYYLGYLKLLGLRQKAQATLGPGFDLKDFHDVVIGNGSLPLLLLEQVVNDYVDRQAGLKSGETLV
jgi:uncharacterized protein (DUF885 family)